MLRGGAGACRAIKYWVVCAALSEFEYTLVEFRERFDGINLSSNLALKEFVLTLLAAFNGECK
jgi:hypothetical protein